MRDRINGIQPRAFQNASRQRLTLWEEQIIIKWIDYLYKHGWPPRIKQLREFAEEILKEKGDIDNLGESWVTAFLRRHPDIKSKFVSMRDRKRVVAQTPEIFLYWFYLFKEQVEKYSVAEEDIYNLDEKGVMIGMGNKIRVILSKYKKNPYSTHSGNREWVTSTECCSLAGRKLGSWTIFKGKVQQKQWAETMRRIKEKDWHIATSVNGWTDNELGMEYLEQHFHPQTKETHSTKGYRILIVDGHDSHVSIKAIKFCITHKIVLLCLPPHSTHLLQPLDVGVFSPLSVYYKNGIQEVY